MGVGGYKRRGELNQESSLQEAYNSLVVWGSRFSSFNPHEGPWGKKIKKEKKKITTVHIKIILNPQFIQTSIYSKDVHIKVKPCTSN